MTTVTIIGGDDQLAIELAGDDLVVHHVDDVRALARNDSSSDVVVLVSDPSQVAEAYRWVQLRWPAAKVVLVSPELPARLPELLGQGAFGLVDSPDRERLRMAIRCVDQGGTLLPGKAARAVASMVATRQVAERGGYGLTSTEFTIWRLAGEGHTNQQIAERLGRSLSTVRTHLRHLHAKLGTASRQGLVETWRRLQQPEQEGKLLEAAAP